MNRSLLCLSLAAIAAVASAIDELPRPAALRIACILAADAGNLRGTPIATDPDIKHPIVIHHEDKGLLLLPETRLAAGGIAGAGAEPRPIGQLWLRNLVPMTGDGTPIAADRLQAVTVQGPDETQVLRRCALGVARRDDGTLELLVYGQAAEPVLRVPLKDQQEAAVSLDCPFSATVVEHGAGGLMRLEVLGRYTAEVVIGEG